MNRRILFVDDELNILQAMQRQLRKTFDVQTALGPERGLHALENGEPFAAVISDYRMPAMNGVEFLTKVRTLKPDTVRLMLTGQADLGTAISAVNQGNIFRFLTKPCPPEMLNPALEAAIEQHRLITAERELLEKTLHGCIKVLTDVLSLVNPGAFSRSCRVRKYITHLTTSLMVRDAWPFDLAAMLCQLGCITVPAEVLSKVASRLPLSDAEKETYQSHPAVARRLLENIPRLDEVAMMIENQTRPPLATHTPLWPFTNPVELGTELLRTALEFERLTSCGTGRDEAIIQMRAARLYPPGFLDVLERAQVDASGYQERLVKIIDLDTQMIINQDVFAANGVLLIAKGLEVTQPVIERLRGFSKTFGIPEPLRVLLPTG